MSGPNLVVLAGPNGAGKTTASRSLLVGELEVQEFVNADIIAKGISSFNPKGVAIQAGRVMLERLQQLTTRRRGVRDNAGEPHFRTDDQEAAAGRISVSTALSLVAVGGMAVERVRERVSRGGHNIPEEVIRRRYEAGLRQTLHER